MLEKRPCPVCGSDKRHIITQFDYQDNTKQVLAECSCGMIYASESPEIDYKNKSKYAVPSASGSGENDREKQRLDDLVSIVEKFVPDKSAKILDIGCARGGLLESFVLSGYKNVKGADPSPECVDACLKKNLYAFEANIKDIAGQYDCIILSHVLEHLWNVNESLDHISDLLATNGILYVETPDALKYSSSVPFMDTNREHVNHFSLKHLVDTINNSGLSLEASGKREFTYFKTLIPSIYSIGRNLPYALGSKIYWYIHDSNVSLRAIDLELKDKLYRYESIILWGYGEFSQTLLRAPVFQSKRIVQIIDRDPSKYGDEVMGLTVQKPSQTLPEYPILISSMVNKESIIKDIKTIGLTNPIITIGD